LRVGHLELGEVAVVRLHGKGDKWRTCPLWRQTADLLGRLVASDDAPPAADAPVFSSATGEALTRFGIYKIVRRHAGHLDDARAPYGGVTSRSSTGSPRSEPLCGQDRAGRAAPRRRERGGPARGHITEPATEPRKCSAEHFGDGVVLGSGEGHALRLGNVHIVVKEDGTHTRGALGLAEFVLPPGGHDVPQPHIHRAHEEGFYILEGELEFLVGTETVRAGQGSFLMVPIGIAHTFSNPTERPARFLCAITPRRYLSYFEIGRAS